MAKIIKDVFLNPLEMRNKPSEKCFGSRAKGHVRVQGWNLQAEFLVNFPVPDLVEGMLNRLELQFVSGKSQERDLQSASEASKQASSCSHSSPVVFHFLQTGFLCSAQQHTNGFMT